MFPPFTMSKYLNIEDLLKDKAFYYEAIAETIAANVDNGRLSDAAFRDFVRNSIPEFN